MVDILELLFPRSCVGCKKPGTYICTSCKKLLQPHAEICPITHNNSPGYATRKDLLTVNNPLDGCIVLFRFDPIIKNLIAQLKYKHRADIASFLAERLTLALQSHEALGQLITHHSTPVGGQNRLIISYVPSHRIRHYITKGYNQSELLAKKLSQSLYNNNQVAKICKKTKHTHSQVGMSKTQRKINLTDAFSVISPIPVGSTILIIDDVLTSGATMIEMAQTIKKSQPGCQVRGLCVARNG